MEKRTFDVTGMTCAACSARVEKATSSVAGVEHVAVNLLKNTMEVSFDGAAQTIEEICKAVDAAGYGATPRGDKTASGTPAASVQRPINTAAEEAKKVKTRLIVSFIFAIPLFYLDMGHMWNWPLPSCFVGHENAMTLALTQFLLVIPIIAVNFKFFRNGFKSLIHGAPTMDTLVALGATASTLWSVVALYRISVALGVGNLEGAHAAAMDLYFESAGLILALITLGKYFEARAKGRTTDAITALMDLAPKNAIRVNDAGEEEEIAAELIEHGDVLVVRAGAAVPVDGEIIEGNGTLDESALTGESIPVDKTVGDTVTGATINKSGYFRMRATHVGDETALAQIIALVDEATGSKAPIQRIADRISSIFVPAVIGIAILVFIIWLFVGNFNWTDAIVHSISVLVISCPCALGLATPTAIMVGMGRGSRAGILIKSAEILESAHDINTVVFDKTGTITKGEPEVTDVVVAEGIEQGDLFMLANGLERKSEHPLGQAICSYLKEHGADVLPTKSFTQVPGQGVRAEIEGATALGGNLRMMQEHDINVTALAPKAKEFASQGKTAIFFAWNGEALGIFALADTLKPTSARAISELKAMGVKTVMLTGDNKRTAQAIKEQVGIDSMVADVLPQDKEAEIRRLQQEGKAAMVGDGINDAAALVRSDLGIAIGAGTDVAIESADMVLMRSDLMDVVAGIQLSRATLRNIKQNLFWALFYNVICIPIAAGALVPLGITLTPDFAAAAMSCSSICVVSNALRLRSWKPIWKTQAN